jgi:O-antigen ligase
MQHIINILIAIFSISLPIYTLKFNISYFQMPFYGIVILFLFFLIIIKEKNIVINYKLDIYREDILILAFLLIILFSYLFHFNIDNFDKIVKLIINIIYCYIFYIVKLKTQLFEKYKSLIFLSALLFISYLIYVFIIVNKKLYIGIDINDFSGTSKNALALFYSIVNIYLLEYINDNSINIYKIIKYIFYIPIVFGMIMIQSKALIIILAIQYLIYFYLKFSETKFDKRNTIFIIFVVCLTLYMLSYFQKAYNLDYFSRFKLMFNSQENNMGSTSIRINMIQKAIDAIFNHPIFGIGIYNFIHYKNDVYFEYLSHNDYLLIFSEFGVIGIIVYTLILGFILKKACISYKISNNAINRINLISIITIIIYLFFINAYDNILIWIIFGLIKAEYIKNKNNKILEKII